MDYIKLGMIMQTNGENNPKKHQIYFSNSIWSLVDKEIIGEADTYQEICKIIKQVFIEKNISYDHYWRIVLDPQATFIDFGSWSKFIAIIPPLSQEELEDNI